MFKITRIPLKFKSFFETNRKDFLFDHHSYFSSLVLAIAVAVGRRNIVNLCRHIETERHRSRFNNFLNVSHRYDLPETLANKAHELLRKLKPQPGEAIELILDDSKKAKRGKVMDGVGWLYDPVQKKSVEGHNYVQALIRFRGFIIPLGVKLYVKKNAAESLDLEYKKLTELACELIESFVPPNEVTVRVLFDSYYLCREVVKAIRDKGFRFISVLKDNRNLYRRGRTHKSRKYKTNLFKRREKTTVSERRSEKVVQYHYIDAGHFDLNGVGQVRVIYSKKGTNDKILGIVTDDPELAAEEIIFGYANRFFIEQFFKDCKQLLGLGQYQNLRHEAAVVHLHLVCFAYALLTHLAIDSSSAQAKSRKRTECQTIGRLQSDFRQVIFEDTLDTMEAELDSQSVFERLRSLLPRAA